jgi:hypothetical protein
VRKTQALTTALKWGLSWRRKPPHEGRTDTVAGGQTTAPRKPTSDIALFDSALTDRLACVNVKSLLFVNSIAYRT